MDSESSEFKSQLCLQDCDYGPGTEPSHTSSTNRDSLSIYLIGQLEDNASDKSISQLVNQPNFLFSFLPPFLPHFLPSSLPPFLSSLFSFLLSFFAPKDSG